MPSKRTKKEKEKKFLGKQLKKIDNLQLQKFLKTKWNANQDANDNLVILGESGSGKKREFKKDEKYIAKLQEKDKKYTEKILKKIDKSFN